MNDQVEIIQRSPKRLLVRIREVSHIDLTLFERMEADHASLPCLLEDKQKGRLAYDIHGKISLEDFLSQYVFSKEDAYLFTIHLFESMISVQQNKPVLLRLDSIYLNGNGNQVYYVVLPLEQEDWLVLQERFKSFLKSFLELFHVQNSYEIIGFLYSFIRSPEFSLAYLVQGLRSSQKQNIHLSFWEHWFRHPKKEFYLKEALYPSSNMDLYVEETPTEKHEEKTQLIGSINRSNAYLLIQEQRYDLLCEDSMIGRGMACDIRLDEGSVSTKHARISFDHDRFYIQDLKSSNGTFLEGKRVQRKMRLKDGMHLQFGQLQAFFYQES